MEDFLRRDMDEFIASPFNQDSSESLESMPVSQWGVFGPPQEKAFHHRRESTDSTYGSMFSPLSASGVSPQSVKSDLAQPNLLGSGQESSNFASSAEVIQVARQAQLAIEDAASANKARSERARKAANQRHSRPKKTGRQSDDSNKVTKGPDLRETVREKNRVAAAKCRRKKKVNEADLESTYRAAVATNNYLKHELLQLRDELTLWRTLALDHMDGHQGCNCADIQQYNKNQAQMTALSVQSQSAYSLGPQAQQEHSSKGISLAPEALPSDKLAAGCDGLSEIGHHSKDYDLKGRRDSCMVT